MQGERLLLVSCVHQVVTAAVTDVDRAVQRIELVSLTGQEGGVVAAGELLFTVVGAQCQVDGTVGHLDLEDGSDRDALDIHIRVDVLIEHGLLDGLFPSLQLLDIGIVQNTDRTGALDPLERGVRDLLDLIALQHEAVHVGGSRHTGILDELALEDVRTVAGQASVLGHILYVICVDNRLSLSDQMHEGLFDRLVCRIIRLGHTVSLHIGNAGVDLIDQDGGGLGIDDGEVVLKAVEEQKNKQAEANQLGLAAQQQNQELQNKAADIMKEIEDYIKNNKKQ